MDVFALRNQLVDDYAAYIESFINISDGRIREHVAAELHQGLLWPDPLLQLNPNFEPGDWIDDLVADGVLHPECSRIFRFKEPNKSDRCLRLHQHQAEAVKAAQSGDNYVLTTGAGSPTYLVVPSSDDTTPSPPSGPMQDRFL